MTEKQAFGASWHFINNEHEINKTPVKNSRLSVFSLMNWWSDKKDDLKPDKHA